MLAFGALSVALSFVLSCIRLFRMPNGGSVTPAKESVSLKAGKTYPFTYIQEESVGIFYIDDLAAFTVRLYGVNDKTILLFAQDNTAVFSDLKMYQR